MIKLKDMTPTQYDTCSDCGQRGSYEDQLRSVDDYTRLHRSCEWLRKWKGTS